MSRQILLSALVLLAAPALTPGVLAEDAIALRGVVHLPDGQALSDGCVVVQGKKIVAVGSWAETAAQRQGATEVALDGAHITPGLIDAAHQVRPGGSYEGTEQRDEVVASQQILAGLDLKDEEWGRLARQGVTTVYVTPEPTAVIGGRGTILKTAGQERLLLAAGDVKTTFGVETWVRGSRNRRPFGSPNYATRRPNTRMGMFWVFREAMAEAAQGKQGADYDVLRAVIAGQARMRFQARMRTDIEAAFRLAGEAGLKTFVLEEATEAYRYVEVLARNKIPVIYGPIFDRPRGPRAGTGEASQPALEASLELARAGVPLALTASDRRGEAGLPHQAMFAMRYGLDRASALATVTSSPAAILGLSERLGSLAPGQDADVVVWSGAPFEATTAARIVLIDGQPVVGSLSSEQAGQDQPVRKRY